MFQSFDVLTKPGTVAPRLKALRERMAEAGLDGFLVPHADEWRNEYQPRASQRLAWLTSFTGSAGFAVVMTQSAHLFVDGRYTLQAREETDTDHVTCHDLSHPGPLSWLENHVPAAAVIGYDPALHTRDEVERLKGRLEKAGAVLRAVEANPLDAVWKDQPKLPAEPLIPHPSALAGRTCAEKRADIAERIREQGCDAHIVTSPLSTAWLLNIRGSDIAHTPVGLSRAVLRSDGRAVLFADPGQVTESLRAHLGDQVSIETRGKFHDDLAKLGEEGATVLLDGGHAAASMADTLETAGASLVWDKDPCELPRACKVSTEVEGARAAHRRDGVAVCRFLAWLAAEAPKGQVDEIAAAKKLEQFRRDTNLLKDISFPTISGAGEHGAIVHYRVNEATNRKLEPGELYLVDSGGQYEDGTTDITRTLPVGEVEEAAKRDYTLVLKGHIALSRARFPDGTTGHQLDVVARAPLWSAGMDYEHGTGHGVGSYLSVHEGPQRLAKPVSSVALKPGMIISIEPGLYREGRWGIRIENLAVVRAAEDMEGGLLPMMRFETLTLAPYERSLIVTEMLDAQERAWIDAYHRSVREQLSTSLDGFTRTWLEAATEPL